MAEKDYYKLLGVGRNASDKEIKQAYRRLARKYHPDVNPGNKSAEAKFKEINEAYEVLSNPESRKKYDEFGDQWRYADQFRTAQSQGGTPFRDFSSGGTRGFRFEDSDMGSLFEDLLAGRFGGRRSRVRRGEDIAQPVEITLEEAFSGVTRTISLESPETCPACKGTGRIQNVPCSTCRGSGVVSRVRRIEAKIPAGVRDGSRVRLSGQGASGVGGGERGDLYLIISVKPHPAFERKGDDLYTDVPVPLTIAMLGGEVELATLKGKIALKIPPETQNGRVFRLTGQGSPRLGDSARGDLFAKVSVVLPQKLSAEERRLLDEFRKLRRDG
ncbi:MAG: J domain-containing protein [Chloroflexota bacterium]